MKWILLAATLLSFHAQAYMCTAYVNIKGGFSLPANCVDSMGGVGFKNPVEMRSDLEQRLVPPYDFKGHNIGGLLLSSNKRLNELYIDYNFNPNFILSEAETKFLKSIHGLKIEHSSEDTYKTSTFYLADLILKGQSSEIKKSIQSCKASKDKDCLGVIHLAWDNYLAGFVESVKNDDSEKFLQSLKDILLDYADKNASAGVSLGILKKDYLDNFTFLKNLPFTKDLSFSKFSLNFSNGNLILTKPEVKLIHLIHMAALFKSELLKSCYFAGCFLHGKITTEKRGTYEFFELIQGYEELIFLTLGHLKERKRASLTEEDIELLTTYLSHFDNFKYVLDSVTANIDENRRFIQVLKRRNSHLKQALSYMAKRLPSLDSREVSLAKGVQKIKLIDLTYSRYLADVLGMVRPSWWGTTTPVSTALDTFSSIDGSGTFLTYRQSLIKSQSKTLVPLDLIETVDEVVGPWNPDFLSSIRDLSIISTLKENITLLRGSEKFLHAYMLDFDSKDSSRDFLKKLLEQK